MGLLPMTLRNPSQLKHLWKSIKNLKKTLYRCNKQAIQWF